MAASASSSRLAKLLLDFARIYEFKISVNPDFSGAVLGIDYRGNLYDARYEFHPSGESYQIGVAARSLRGLDKKQFSHNLLRSEATVGITERIAGGKVVILGGKDGLGNRSDAEIQRGYQDDVARISSHLRHIDSISDR